MTSSQRTFSPRFLAIFRVAGSISDNTRLQRATCVCTDVLIARRVKCVRSDKQNAPAARVTSLQILSNTEFWREAVDACAILAKDRVAISASERYMCVRACDEYFRLYMSPFSHTHTHTHFAAFWYWIARTTSQRARKINDSVGNPRRLRRLEIRYHARGESNTYIRCGAIFVTFCYSTVKGDHEPPQCTHQPTPEFVESLGAIDKQHAYNFRHASETTYNFFFWIAGGGKTGFARTLAQPKKMRKRNQNNVG
jgi:hypothetical protein